MSLINVSKIATLLKRTLLNPHPTRSASYTINTDNRPSCMKLFLLALKMAYSSGFHPASQAAPFHSLCSFLLISPSYCSEVPRGMVQLTLFPSSLASFIQFQGLKYHLNNDNSYNCIFNLTSPLNSRLGYPDALESFSCRIFSHTPYPIIQWILVALPLKYTCNLSIFHSSLPSVATVVP